MKRIKLQANIDNPMEVTVQFSWDEVQVQSIQIKLNLNNYVSFRLG